MTRPTRIAPSRVGAGLALALAAACAAAPGDTGSGVAASRAEPSVGAPLNRARAAAGLGPLAPSRALDAAALAQARYTASVGRLTHRSAGGANVKDRVEARGFDACLAAENLAAGQPDARSVTAGWLASPAHRSNMLLPQATHYGSGSATTADGTRYWALVLARPC